MEEIIGAVNILLHEAGCQTFSSSLVHSILKGTQERKHRKKQDLFSKRDLVLIMRDSLAVFTMANLYQSFIDSEGRKMLRSLVGSRRTMLYSQVD